MKNVPIRIDFHEKHISGIAVPTQSFTNETVATTHSIYLEGELLEH